MRSAFIILFIIPFTLFQCIDCFSQISYSHRPHNNQLYPRNTSSNRATVVVSGTVTALIYSRIRLDVYRNNVLQASTPAQNATQNSNFSFTYSIPAELANYKFVVLLENSSNTWTTTYTADNVVAGDAIIIQGQSNAVASQYWSGEPVSASYHNSFIRVLGSGTPTLNSLDVANLQWYTADPNADAQTNANTGQWGYVMASLMMAKTNVPVAIFNGGDGAKGIEFFRRNAGDPGDLNTNYGRLFSRVQKGGFLNSIRAIFWFQGESDTWDADENLESYKTKWNEIYNGWKTDFPTAGQRFYIMQIRYGCNAEFSRTKFVNEALRQLALEHSGDTRIYGTGSLQQEPADAGDPSNRFCHYRFTGGYEKLGIDLSRIVLFDLYGYPLPPASLSPIVTEVTRISANQVRLTLQNADPLSITEGALGNFTFEGAATQPGITATISGNYITLQLSAYPSGVTGLSYNDQPSSRGQNSPDIVSTTYTLSLINFTNVPIIEKIESPLPLKLTSFEGVFQDANSVRLKWRTTDEVNVSGYEILYSKNGLDFNKVGFVDANSVGGEAQYLFTHQALFGSSNLYKLKMIDRDGSFTYSPTINLKNNNELKGFKVSVNPNPAINNAQVFIESNSSGKAEIIIMNNLGQRMRLLSRNVQSGINTFNLPGEYFTNEGFYFIKVEMQGATQILKFFFAQQ